MFPLTRASHSGTGFLSHGHMTPLQENPPMKAQKMIEGIEKGQCTDRDYGKSDTPTEGLRSHRTPHPTWPGGA